MTDTLWIGFRVVSLWGTCDTHDTENKSGNNRDSEDSIDFSGSREGSRYFSFFTFPSDTKIRSEEGPPCLHLRRGV